MSAHLGTIQTVNTLIGRVFKQPRGDFADRLNSLYTVVVLSISSGLLLSSHYWGSPITCWTPAEFTATWATFVNQYCYVHGTYFHNITHQLDFDPERRQYNIIRYYQWVPYVLALQAFLFYIPRFFMRLICAWSDRIESFEKIAAVYVWDGLRLYRRKNRGTIGAYYLLYTFLQTLNAWFNFYFLNLLIASSMDGQSGITIVYDLITGSDWQETGHFPRITHCDFQRRKPGSIQWDTVLCVLTLNIYYEKILLFLWFWMLAVSVISTGHFFYWVLQCCFTNAYVIKLLRSFLLIHSKSTFVEKFFKIIGRDGQFILHQIALNIGDLPASYLALAMLNIVEDLETKGEDASLLLEKGPKSV
uniref:Innexin n=1 Tax=Panagrolaimus sp. ES5 TaxID=591445 RepID=A0AC34FAD1_9BILA